MSRSRNRFFLAPLWAVPRGVAQKISGVEIAFAAQQIYTKVRFSMFYGLREKERKTKKQRKKLIAAKSGLVGMKGYAKKYNHVKNFLPYFSRF